MWKQIKFWQQAATWLGLLMLLAAVTACNFTQSAFALTANNAGSAFAAAETTLAYEHAGKITPAYASSSFLSYQSELSGTDQSLISQATGDKRTLHRLLALYMPAMQVVNAPCLSNSCNWQKQLTQLKNASTAFNEAGS